MLEHAGEVSICDRFESEIAEISRKPLNMWKKSNSKWTKMGVTLTKTIQSFPNVLDGTWRM